MKPELECEWCKSVYTFDQSNATQKKRFCSAECERNDKRYSEEVA